MRSSSSKALIIATCREVVKTKGERENGKTGGGENKDSKRDGTGSTLPKKSSTIRRSPCREREREVVSAMIHPALTPNLRPLHFIVGIVGHDALARSRGRKPLQDGVDLVLRAPVQTFDKHRVALLHIKLASSSKPYAAK
jgi:hypothetical protein